MPYEIIDFPAKIVGWETVRNIANQLTNQIYLAPGVNVLQAHMCDSSIGSRDWTGSPSARRAAIGNCDFEWLAFDESDASHFLWESGSSGNLLRATRVARGVWELVYAPSPNDPTYRGIYHKMYADPEAVENISWESAHEVYSPPEIFDLVSLGNQAKNVGGGDYTVANLAFAAVIDRAMANPTIVGLAIESQDPSGKDINEAYYDLVVVSAGYGASCVPESLCVPLPLLKPEAVATLLKRGAFQYRERAVHDRVITEDVEELEEIRSKLLDIIGGEEAAIGLCQEYLGTTECVGTHLP